MEEKKVNSMSPHLCKRGVVYVTKLCNTHCEFCYYRDEKNKKHTPFDSIERTFEWFRRQYKLEYVDVTGGEPTIHPQIIDIIKSACAYGIKPTVITNAQKPELFHELIPAGLEDVLMSVHGDEKTHDDAVGVKGAFRKLCKTVEVLQQHEFTFRTNTTLTSFSVSRLKEIVSFFKEIKPRIVNFIAFNPHEGTLWAQKESVKFQLPFPEIVGPLHDAMASLEAAGIWTNVRYMPLCMMKGLEPHVCNFLQWQFDPYEWEETASQRMSIEKVNEETHAACEAQIYGATPEEKLHTYLMKKGVCVNIFAPQCERCDNRNICDGIYPQYAKRFGTDAFIPTEIAKKKIEDPLYYRRQDMRWAIMKGKV